jgi:hypothetical protein
MVGLIVLIIEICIVVWIFLFLRKKYRMGILMAVICTILILIVLSFVTHLLGIGLF